MRVCCYLGAWLMCATPFARAAANVDYIAAIVNDSVITFREVEDYTFQAVEFIRRTHAQQPAVLKERYNQTMQEGLEQLLEKQLILDEFKGLGARVPDTIIEDDINDRIRQTYGDRATLAKTLKARGITFEAFRKRIHDEIVMEHMRRKNVSSAILISPQKIEQYYQTNLAEFQLSDQVKLRMIVLNKPAGAVDDLRNMGLEIIRKLDEGATFAEMASVYTERRDGGDWGWVETNRLNRGLSEIAFSLQANQRSGLLALARDGDAYWIYQYGKDGTPSVGNKYADRGEVLERVNFAGDPARPVTVPVQPTEYYLMFVEDKRPARTRTLAEAREEIEKTLTNHERTRLHKKWIERLKAKAFVRYF